MKQLVLSMLAFTLLLSACKNGEQEKTDTDIKTSVLPYISGTWVMTDYINDLEKTRSPLASSSKLQGIVSMMITPEVAAGDSLPVSASINNHEGISFNIIFKHKHDDKQVMTDLGDVLNNGNFYELGYDVSKNDTTIILYEYGKDDKAISRRSFTKVTGPLTEDSEPYGLQYMTNKVLLSGRYIAQDDKGKTDTVTFTEDGMLSGIEGHNTYNIFTDFTGEQEGYLIDELFFDMQTKQQKPYIFKINGNTVLLYEAKENAERTKLEQGALKYTLVKQ